MEEPPPLYKYCTLETATKILVSRRLRWTSPLYFNDPFDCQWDQMWQIGDGSYINKGWEIVRAFVTGENSNWSELARSKNGPGAVRRLLQENRSYVSCQTEKEREQLLGRIQHEFRQTRESKKGEYIKGLMSVIEVARVLCMSANNSSILMWSHYADEHRGIVLELDPAILLQSDKRVLHPVAYSETYPEVYEEQGPIEVGTYDREFVARSNRKAEEVLLFTKAAEWKYESEWRAVWFDLTALPSPVRPKPNEVRHSDCEFGEGAIRSVITGCRFSENCYHDRTQFERAINGISKLPPPVIQARKSLDSFKVDVRRDS